MLRKKYRFISVTDTEAQLKKWGAEYFGKNKYNNLVYAIKQRISKDTLDTVIFNIAEDGRTFVTIKTQKVKAKEPNTSFNFDEVFDNIPVEIKFDYSVLINLNTVKALRGF
mgnify:CR=1 FL=1